MEKDWYLTRDWQKWSKKRQEDETWGMPLNSKHSHPRDAFLAYDDAPHKYYLFGSQQVCPSVSSVCAHFFPQFDKMLMGKRTVESKEYKLGMSRYNGMNADEIVALWDANGKAASERGTQLHSEVEWYLNYEQVRPAAKNLSEFQQFLDLYATEILADDLVPYRTEWRLYGLPFVEREEKDKEKNLGNLYIPGTVDALFIKQGADRPARDVPLELELWDWKDSKGLEKDNSRKGKGFGPLSHIPNTNYHHYCINLNLYRWILQRHYNVSVTKMVLGVVHPTFQDGYKKTEVPVLVKETEQVVEEWWKHLEQVSSRQE